MTESNTPKDPGDALARLDQIIRNLEQDCKVNGDGYFRPYIEMLTELKAALSPKPSGGDALGKIEMKFQDILISVSVAQEIDPEAIEDIKTLAEEGRKMCAALTPQPIPDGWIMVPRELMQDLYVKAQEIGYHAEMDTIKGKRRGHWIQPVAYKMIELLTPYKADAAPKREVG